MSERELREQIGFQGKSLFSRRYTSGSSGNISVKLPDGILITPPIRPSVRSTQTRFPKSIGKETICRVTSPRKKPSCI